MAFSHLQSGLCVIDASFVGKALARLDKYEVDLRQADAANRSAMAEARSAVFELGVPEYIMDKWDGSY